MKKAVSFIIVFSILLSSCLSVNAGNIATEYYSDDLISDIAVSTTPKMLADSVKSAILIERDTGKVLYEQNANEKCSPASITKIMSLILVMEAIEKGTISYSTKITASEHACSMGGSQIWLEPQEQMTVNDLLKAVACASANDATVALAEAVSGSEEEFVNKMNEKAAALKMNSTHFVNCSGLDADEHYSTAHDVAVMSAELLKHKDIKKYTTLWMETLRGGESELVNTNKLIRFYKDATGLKTGTTSKAGFCVSASAERNGMELCAVIMGAKNNDDRFSSAKNLLNYGFANYKKEELGASALKVRSFSVKGGTNDKIKAKPYGKVEIIIKSGESDGLSFGKLREQNLKAPIVKGQKVAEVPIISGGREIGKIDYIASTGSQKFTFLEALKLVISSIFTP